MLKECQTMKPSPISSDGEPDRAMTDPKRLVLDANVLLGAVFGARVRNPLESYESIRLFRAVILATVAKKECTL